MTFFDTADTPTDPHLLIRPRRPITGISATLLPFSDGAVAWDDFRAHVARTVSAGLTPAVNMDTGYVNLITPKQRRDVLAHTRDVLGASSSFVAGAFVADSPGDAFDLHAYLEEVDQIHEFGGTPIIFQSYGLTSGDVVASYGRIADRCPAFIAFELGQMFAPFGRIYSIETFEGLLGIPQCIGAKHSSLSRRAEWQRLAARDRIRPDFKVFTGNDLAIDMVIYGSDYLLGLSTFAPDAFARRDALWAEGDPSFYQLNDLLQYLGFFAFRTPVPAYKHSAAQFLKIRGWLGSSEPHPKGARRPDGDVAVLTDIAERLEAIH